MEIWGEIPPPFVSLSILARTHGAEFGKSRPGSRPSPAQGPADALSADPVNPESMLGFFGQSEPVPYRPPARGLRVLN